MIETLAWYVPKGRTQRDLFYNRSFFELNVLLAFRSPNTGDPAKTFVRVEVLDVLELKFQVPLDH